MSRLKSLKKDALTDLCRNAGVDTSGTKPELAHRLIARFEHTLKLQSPLPPEILSIDIGWRNFSYCRMDSHNGKIKDWARLDLGADDTNEQYDPIRYGQTIHKLCNQILTAEKKAIVVERQRYRSKSAASVFEWTIRANTVEAMVHANIQSRQHDWEVETVFPRRVAMYYFPNESKITKSMRMKLVKGLLDGSGEVKISKTSMEMFAAEKKKDDLSDSLLQALAWREWRKFTIAKAKEYLGS